MCIYLNLCLPEPHHNTDVLSPPLFCIETEVIYFCRKKCNPKGGPHYSPGLPYVPLLPCFSHLICVMKFTVRGLLITKLIHGKLHVGSFRGHVGAGTQFWSDTC